VLLHGVTGSSKMWARVMPLLAPQFDVIALTLLGHRGGRSSQLPRTRVQDVIDDAERSLDQLGLQTAHFAGNSLGGWVALELARRGRARSVCALSPAGVWASSRPSAATRKLQAVVRKTRMTRAILPWLAKVPAVRTFALRENAVHGERVSADELVALADDLLGCGVRDDLFGTDEALAPLRTRCPITLAWSAQDRVFPPEQHVGYARALMPEAKLIVLEQLGHVPMMDDPARVAQVIRAATHA
jgi:pimeloyl-ACP methyl ester carboxylesterase